MRLKFILLLFLLLIFTSCDMFTQNQYGFPTSVAFTVEGGEKILRGNNDFSLSEYGFSIENVSMSKLSYQQGENDTIIQSYDWLTIKYVNKGHDAKLIVAPSVDGKKRDVVLQNTMATEYSLTKVIQF